MCCLCDVVLIQNSTNSISKKISSDFRGIDILAGNLHSESLRIQEVELLKFLFPKKAKIFEREKGKISFFLPLTTVV